MSTVKRLIGAFIFGVLGVLFGLAALHLYTDHQNLHALVDMVVQQRAAQAKAATPTAPEPAK